MSNDQECCTTSQSCEPKDISANMMAETMIEIGSKVSALKNSLEVREGSLINLRRENKQLAERVKRAEQNVEYERSDFKKLAEENYKLKASIEEAAKGIDKLKATIQSVISIVKPSKAQMRKINKVTLY